MWKVFSSIFGNGDQADQIIDGAKKGIDAIVFTPEEKNEAGRSAFKLWIEFMEATKGQNVARRWIAILVTILWSVMVVVTALLAVASSAFEWAMDPAAAVLEVIGAYRVTEIVLLIMGFYFGKHLLTAGLEARKKD